MPNSSTRGVAEAEAQAAMCLAATSGPVPMASQSHCRMVRALSIVSAVVKDLDTTSTSVSSGSSFSCALDTSTGSTLLRKRRRKSCEVTDPSSSVLNTSWMHAGPR